MNNQFESFYSQKKFEVKVHTTEMTNTSTPTCWCYELYYYSQSKTE